MQLVAILFFCLFNIEPAYGQEPGSPTKPVFDEVAKLVKAFFPNAKIVQNASKLRFEYKVAPQISTSTHLAVIGPKEGGILGEIEAESGVPTTQPKTQNEYYYLTVCMVPYSASHNCHLKAKLSYPSETSPDFVDKFKDILKDFGDTLPASADDKKVPEEKSSGAVERVQSVSTKAKETKHKLFFWKATKGADVVYLLGTIHAAPPTLYPLAPEIESAFDSSKCLLVEVNIAKAKIDPEKVRSLVSTSGKYTPPDKLSKHLSPGTKSVFEAYLNWAGETWEIYEAYKPWYVRELISVPRRGDLSKMSKSNGIDLHFLKKAITLKKPVDEFETIEFQLALDSKLSEDVQDKLLQVTLLEMKDTEQTMASIFQAWKAGDMEQMEKVAVHQSVDNPALIPFTMALLNNRNLAMASKIEPFLKTKGSPLFVAVGSAHMVGETGLVNLLRKKGFEVEQILTDSSQSRAR